MKIIVQKYGGTSVKNKEQLEIVSNKIIQSLKNNTKLVIVVSAQGKETDNLIKNAYTYSNNPDKRSLDLLLSTGELRTVAYLSMLLNNKGYNTVGLTGEQAGIFSNSEYGNAKIDSIYTNNILSYLKDNYIVIVAGFQAVDRLGNITTLGRGGSDLTAVALAANLKAKKCEIYTDVDGIYSSDPRIIKKSKLLKKVSYDKMLEAASSGAKVLHDKCVFLAKKENLKISVKNTNLNKKGSIVTNNDNNKNISFVSCLDNLSKISIIGDMMMKDKETLKTISNIAKEKNYNIHMISLSELSIGILVDTNISKNFIQDIHKKLIEEKEEL